MEPTIGDAAEAAHESDRSLVLGYNGLAESTARWS
jgi:hypothetical protein